MRVTIHNESFCHETEAELQPKKLIEFDYKTSSIPTSLLTIPHPQTLRANHFCVPCTQGLTSGGPQTITVLLKFSVMKDRI